MRVSIIGGDVVDESAERDAYEVGRLLGEHGHTVVCGGLGGVMEAACRGANEVGGKTIGILACEDRDAANDYVDTPIVTGIGHARNALVVMNGDAAIAISGSSGTLSEIGFSAVYDHPIAGIDAPDAPHVEVVDAPEEAVEYVESQVD